MYRGGRWLNQCYIYCPNGEKTKLLLVQASSVGNVTTHINQERHGNNSFKGNRCKGMVDACMHGR